MDREQTGGWVYIMADRYRGTMYVGVTAHLAQRISQHRQLRLKRWRREWKFALIENRNPDWADLFAMIV